MAHPLPTPAHPVAPPTDPVAPPTDPVAPYSIEINDLKFNEFNEYKQKINEKNIIVIIGAIIGGWSMIAYAALNSILTFSDDAISAATATLSTLIGPASLISSLALINGPAVALTAKFGACGGSFFYH